MAESDDSIALSVLKLLLILAVSVLTSFYWGWAFMTLWGWFAVMAAGLPSLPYVTWVGASFLIGQVTTCVTSLEKYYKAEKDSESSPFTKFLFTTSLKILASLFGLVFAYAVFLILL